MSNIDIIWLHRSAAVVSFFGSSFRFFGAIASQLDAPAVRGYLPFFVHPLYRSSSGTYSNVPGEEERAVTALAEEVLELLRGKAGAVPFSATASTTTHPGAMTR